MIDREIRIENAIRLRVRNEGLHEYEGIAIDAGVQHSREDLTSDFRCIEAGLKAATDKRQEFIGG